MPPSPNSKATQMSEPAPIVLVVDLGLPDMDGSEVVERIRSWSSVPIIVLSVRSTEAQKVHLLELGADDYVVKPFGMAELLARVRVALRRQMRAERGEAKVKVRPPRHTKRLPHDADAEGIPAAAGAGAARRQRGH